MAEKMWVGGAAVVRQLNTITPGSVDIGDTFTVTINNKSVTFTATAATVANVTAGLTAALNASEEGEFAEVDWADTGTTITGTGPEDGTPFTQTSSSVGGTLSTAVTTAASSPNHVSVAANWSQQSLPAAGDHIQIANTDVSMLHGTLANKPATITFSQSFTGTVGLPAVNQRGYAEYRPVAMDLAAGSDTILFVGTGNGPGSGRIRLTMGAGGGTAAAHVFATGSPIDTGLPALRLVGGQTALTLNVMGGSVGMGVDGTMQPDSTSLVGGATTVRVAGGTFHAGRDFVTAFGSTWSIVGGSAVFESLGGTLTACTITDGTLTVGTTGAATTLNVDGGTVDWRSSGMITTLRVSDGGTIDFAQDIRPRTVTNCTLYSGAAMLDPFRTVTFTNGVQLVRSSLADLRQIDVGTHLTLTIAAGP